MRCWGLDQTILWAEEGYHSAGQSLDPNEASCSSEFLQLDKLGNMPSYGSIYGLNNPYLGKVPLK